VTRLILRKTTGGLFCTALALSLGLYCTTTPVMAQLASQILAPDGKTIPITGRNASRGEDAFILYTPAFGKETRTNPHGVEVVAVPASPKTATDVKPTNGATVYQVVQVTRAAECSSQKSALTCGSAAIPPNGIVLSATGARRDWPQKLQPGNTFTLLESWTQNKSVHLNVVNPSPQNNPPGSGFPGYRASNQIVLYNNAYGRPTTGTNEFGFEVTVRNGIVTAQEGSDSAIPNDGFVLSGHGKGRSWLINNTPPGTHVNVVFNPNGRDGTLNTAIDFDTYLYQFNQRWAESPCAAGAWNATNTMDAACAAIREKKDAATRLYQSQNSAQNQALNPSEFPNLIQNPVIATAPKPPSDPVDTRSAINLLNEALESLNHRTWISYSPFPAQSIRGAWHRPVERSAESIGKTLDRLQAAGLNAVFLETFFHGSTIFPSQTFQSYQLPLEGTDFDGVDLLKLWVDEAHKRHMQLHVWFQTFYGGARAYSPPGPILARYPDWANIQYSALVPVQAPVPAHPVDAIGAAVAQAEAPPTVMKAPDKPVPSTLETGGYFLDPANPNVQAFLMKLADEIVTRYPVDGFQLDYIRYPASFPADRFSYRKTTWGYTNVARAAFKDRYGIDPADIDPKVPAMANLWLAWADFKTQQVNHFVDRITHELHRRRPGLRISAAIFPDANSALTLKHQDWKTWGRNGWLDFYAPMTLTSALKVIEHDTKNMARATENKIPVTAGIFGPFNDNSADQVLSQLNTARQAGAQGYVLFDTAHLTQRMLEALQVVQTAPPVTTATIPAAVPSVLNSADKNGKNASGKAKKRHWWNW
jgi:uncharacterized lipoprotein YddW (UPF0748 family)